MEQNEAQYAEYPRGRGYGHDYMRGGEVFGGYGYQERDEYERPRGAAEQAATGSEGEARRTDGAAAGESAGDGDGAEGDEEPERFPQDERAGDWPVPHDLMADERGPRAAREPEGGPHADAAEAPVPQIEHTYGDTGGTRMHSRSYYVTQAQLQQRILKS